MHASCFRPREPGSGATSDKGDATETESEPPARGALALLAALLPSSGPGPGRDSCLHSRQLHPSRAAWPSQSLAVKGDEIRRRLHCSDSSTRQPLIVARVVVCCKGASSRRTFRCSACTVDFVRARAPAQRNFLNTSFSPVILAAVPSWVLGCKHALGTTKPQFWLVLMKLLGKPKFSCKVLCK